MYPLIWVLSSIVLFKSFQTRIMSLFVESLYCFFHVRIRQFYCDVSDQCHFLHVTVSVYRRYVSTSATISQFPVTSIQNNKRNESLITNCCVDEKYTDMFIHAATSNKSLPHPPLLKLGKKKKKCRQ